MSKQVTKKRETVNSIKASYPIASPEELKKLKTYLGIVIFAFALLLYAQSVTFKYTLDDSSVTYENKIVTKGIAGIPELIRTDYWYGFDENLRVPEFRPTSLILLATEWQFFPDTPSVYHLVNVLLFSLTCLLIFFLLSRILEGYAIIVPFICTLLYAAHPIHTEVVDSIKSMDEILCFLFASTSLFFTIIAYDKNRIWMYALAAISFLLSLCSKETSISFLIIIPGVLFIFRKPSIKSILYVSSIFVITTLAFLFIRYEVIKSLPDKMFTSPLANSLNGAPNFASQKATAFLILLKYVFLMIFPHPLSCDYSFSQIKIQTFSDPGAFFGLVLYIALGIYMALKYRINRIAAFAILFYLLTLSPVSNIFIIIGSTMAERFMYMPSLGFCLLITFIIAKLTKTDIIRNSFSNFSQLINRNKNLLLVVLIFLGLYSAKTIARSWDWKDNINLFGTDVKTVPNSAKAHFYWGNSLLMVQFPAEKDSAKKMLLLDQSIREFTSCVNIYPSYHDAYFDRGHAYKEKKEWKNMITDLEKSKSLYFKPTPLFFKELGFAYAEVGNLDSAIKNLDSALVHQYDWPEVHNNLGSMYAKKGRYDDAFKEFNKAISQDPKYQNAYHNIGVNYGRLKDFPKAIESFNKALALDSTDAKSMYYLGVTYGNMGDKEKAEFYIDKSSKLKNKTK
ncbi:MAG: tetratricopeptide repeat protein [Bacteroidota bacterium]